MVTIPFATSDWRRTTVKEPVVKLQNRFFEQNPTNLVEGSSLVTRPGFSKFLDADFFGANGVNRLYTQEGIFNNDLFALTDVRCYRVNDLGASTVLGTGTFSTSGTTGIFVGGVGTIPPYFYYTNGISISLYPEESQAINRLGRSGTIENNAVVVIGGVYYKFTSGSVDTGTPAGTSANPWLVALADATNTAMQNLAEAVDIQGTPGSDYSSATTKNLFANVSTSIFGSYIDFYANKGGVLGNQVAVSVSATAVLSWSTPTFTGGGLSTSTSTYPVPLPTGQGNAVSLGTINSYVLVATDRGGRFYWIEPGETYIDELNFASTELKPDSLISVRVVGDQIWFIGNDTIEIWYATGDFNSPFRRAQGRTFNFGGYGGSDEVLDDSLIFVGSDSVVYQFDGTNYKRISDNGIEERIRHFITSDEYLSTTYDDFRVWPLWTDGHTMYILNLGTQVTLVYDLTTEQWFEWKTYGIDYLRPHTGVKWTSIRARFRTITADLRFDSLFFVDEEYRLDDIPSDDTRHYLIECAVTAGTPMRMRDTLKCNQLYLTGSVGTPLDFDFAYLIDPDGFILTDPDGAWLIDSLIQLDYNWVDSPLDVKLEYSDDNGVTWINAGVNLLDFASYEQEIVWRSLGLIKAPGRVFRITDYGQMKRLDGLDMS